MILSTCCSLTPFPHQMKHFQATLKAATIVGTFAASMKALSNIRDETEDIELQRLLDDAICHLQNANAVHGSGVVPSALEKHQDARAKSLIAYCRKLTKDAVADWQIMARKNGWIPAK
jgi:hypothetical protein